MSINFIFILEGEKEFNQDAYIYNTNTLTFVLAFLVLTCVKLNNKIILNIYAILDDYIMLR